MGRTTPAPPGSGVPRRAPAVRRADPWHAARRGSEAALAALARHRVVLVRAKADDAVVARICPLVLVVPLVVAAVLAPLREQVRERAG